MAPFLQQMKFILTGWLNLPLTVLETDGSNNVTGAPKDIVDKQTAPPELPEFDDDPYNNPTKRYSTHSTQSDGGGEEKHSNYELVLIDDVPTFSPTEAFALNDVIFEGTQSNAECPLYSCTEEDCCGAGTVYDYSSGECLPDIDSIGFVSWSDQHQQGCAPRACVEADCCGFGEAVGDFIWSVVYFEGKCVLQMQGTCVTDEMELLELSGVNENLEPVMEENMELRRARYLEDMTNATKSIDYDKEKKLKWSDFEKDLDEDDDTKDAATATTQLLRKYCDGVKEGNKAYIQELSIVAVMVPSQSEVKKSIREDPETEANKALLAHEQRHFDLSDYCARKMMAELKLLTATGTSPRDAKNKLRKTFKAKRAELRKECDELHQHGSGAEQNAWDAKVDELVKKNFRRHSRRMAWKETHQRHRHRKRELAARREL